MLRHMSKPACTSPKWSTNEMESITVVVASGYAFQPSSRSSFKVSQAVNRKPFLDLITLAYLQGSKLSFILILKWDFSLLKWDSLIRFQSLIQNSTRINAT